ncbi:T9SS type A sorting domain-containing protein [Flavobacterium plurextorum]|uniref:T9SS type A sorting domain-containing protein n=1 Tax=Flavobacterium TaxID=237 RepID=UPI00214D89F4|nr:MULTISPECIES: T9SS type A sorting domain-containing protein [Flavobacterium]UUW11524.1 T9SS type A sorting domain-containing protein [Flavobacterium plurextorum]
MKTKLLLFFFIFLFTEVNAQQEIYNFSPGTPMSSVHFNKKFFFEGYETGTGKEIWQSDGTTSNTSLLKDINVGSGNSTVANLKQTSTILNDDLYFIAKDVDSNGEIWKINGKTEVPEKITTFLNGRVTRLTTVGNTIFFIIRNVDNTIELWKTDGTAVGTVMIKNDFSIWNRVSFQGKCNNTFIFTFQPQGSNNSRVWRSDGTSGGTFPITEEIDGNGSGKSTEGGSTNGGTSILSQYIEYKNKLYFVSRFFLFETDGTLANTKSVGNTKNKDSKLVDFSDIIEVNGSFYLMFFTSSINNLTLLKFNSESHDIFPIYDKTSMQYFFPSNFVKTENSLLFSSFNSTGGTSLVSMDLSTNVVSNVKELSLANDLERPVIFRDINRGGILKINKDEYFIMNSREKNTERKGWILNNTLQTTENISSLDNILEPFAYNDYLYYSKDNKLYKFAKNLSTVSVDQRKSLNLYPNPSKNFVNFYTEDYSEIEDIQIFDLNGRLVSGRSDLNGDKIDISNLHQGTYILKAKINGAEITKKIIKK